jgi:hypothetical protein
MAGEESIGRFDDPEEASAAIQKEMARHIEARKQVLREKRLKRWVDRND